MAFEISKFMNTEIWNPPALMNLIMNVWPEDSQILTQMKLTILAQYSKAMSVLFVQNVLPFHYHSKKKIYQCAKMKLVNSVSNILSISLREISKYIVKGLAK